MASATAMRDLLRLAPLIRRGGDVDRSATPSSARGLAPARGRRGRTRVASTRFSDAVKKGRGSRSGGRSRSGQLEARLSLHRPSLELLAPSKSIRPSSGAESPASTAMSVDLPLPDAPVRLITSPAIEIDAHVAQHLAIAMSASRCRRAGRTAPAGRTCFSSGPVSAHAHRAGSTRRGRSEPSAPRARRAGAPRR